MPYGRVARDNWDLGYSFGPRCQRRPVQGNLFATNRLIPAPVRIGARKNGPYSIFAEEPQLRFAMSGVIKTYKMGVVPPERCFVSFCLHVAPCNAHARNRLSAPFFNDRLRWRGGAIPSRTPLVQRDWEIDRPLGCRKTLSAPTWVKGLSTSSRALARQCATQECFQAHQHVRF